MNAVFTDRTTRGLTLATVSLALVISVAGCSTINDLASGNDVIDYKSAGKLPRLDVPPDLISPRGDDRYAIPERQQRERTYSGFQSARASDRVASDPRVLPSMDGMRIERSGSQRWLVVDQPADRLWPTIREFWQESGFLIQTESPATGILETEWAENRAKLPQDFIRRTLGRVMDSLYSTGERDRFRTRLEKGQGGSTEIYISHRGMVEVYGSAAQDSTVWQPRPSDPGLEAEFLRRLMVKLGAGEDKSKAIIAQTDKPQETARLVGSDAGTGGLEVREGFERAWRRVGLALDRGGFTVEDRDRSKGIYFVRYIDPEVAGSQKKGVLNRWFGIGSGDKGSAQQYQVVVQAMGEGSTVMVRSKDGQTLSVDVDLQTARKILALLQDQLIQ